MPTSFDIAGVPVGDGAPVFIIAELSANHAGKKDIALKTIEAAAKAGVNAIKLQTYTPDTITLKSDAPPFVVGMKNEWAGRKLHDLYAEAMTPWEWHAELKACAEANGLVFFSSPFDPTAVEFLDRLGVPAYKIASFELVDLPLVDHVARRGKPMILSTGMASLGEIEAAIATCRAAGNERLVLLRCVSTYPARPEMMNLQSFHALKAFGTVVGLSDHTRDSTAAIASVALGAKVIEKHFILDRSVGGPDAFFSLEPSELADMVNVVRSAELALGPPRFGVSADERASVRYRRSLFVARDVAAGAVLTTDDVRSVRPADGLATEHLPAVLGRRAARAVTAGTPLAWDMLGAAESSDVTLTPAQSAGAFVAAHGGEPVAQLQLEATGDPAAATWSVAIALSSGGRREELAAAALRALEAPARDLGARLLSTRIDATDTATIGAFKRAGYYAFVEREADGRSWLHAERRIVPFAT